MFEPTFPLATLSGVARHVFELEVEIIVALVVLLMLEA